MDIETHPQSDMILAELKKRLAASSEAELINIGLSILQWIVLEMDAGRRICSLDDETKQCRELKLGALAQLTKKRMVN